jgi:hypothetical protein
MTDVTIKRRGAGLSLCLSLAAVLGPSVLAGCDEGYSTQDAAAYCDIERENNPTMSDELYQTCIACFEACGGDCRSRATTPVTFECEE